VVAAGCGGEHRSTLQRDVDAAAARGVPGVLVYARDGDRTQVATAGLADRATGGRMRADLRFRIGSVTKTLVAAVALQLVADHRLRLDDTVEQLLPGLLRDGSHVSVRDLLAHRSGLADVADDPSVLAGARSSWAPRRLVALADAQPRTTRTFHYSSTNYLVLGLALERVTGTTVASLLQHRIAAPLGLHDTTFSPGRVAGPHVHGYRLPAHQGVVDPTAAPRDVEARSARWAWAAGDVVSTAADVATFLAALMRGELVPRAQLAAMEDVRARYGLGLAIAPTRCGPAWGHTGNLNGVLTIAWSTRDGSRQAVVVGNAYPLPGDAEAALRRAAVDALCG
jgi:D-alanyl-D-alanine carboxypeptidase